LEFDPAGSVHKQAIQRRATSAAAMTVKKRVTKRAPSRQLHHEPYSYWFVASGRSPRRSLPGQRRQVRRHARCAAVRAGAPQVTLRSPPTASRSVTTASRGDTRGPPTDSAAAGRSWPPAAPPPPTAPATPATKYEVQGPGQGQRGQYRTAEATGDSTTTDPASDPTSAQTAPTGLSSTGRTSTSVSWPGTPGEATNVGVVRTTCTGDGRAVRDRLRDHALTDDRHGLTRRPPCTPSPEARDARTTPPTHPPRSPSPPTTRGTGKYLKVGYFAQGIYGRQYFVKNLEPPARQPAGRRQLRPSRTSIRAV